MFKCGVIGMWEKQKTIDPTTWNIREHFQMQLFLVPSQRNIIITNRLQVFFVY